MTDDLCRGAPELRARTLSRIPLDRFGEPPDLAGAIVFTGTTIVVDGGHLA